jgi:hypothetical protein
VKHFHKANNYEKLVSTIKYILKHPELTDQISNLLLMDEIQKYIEIAKTMIDE